MSCYRPISDDEGIDLIVKEKGSFGRTVYLQVKSRFGTDVGKQFTATTKCPAIADRAFAFIFCHFEIDHGDLWDYLWFIPSQKLVKQAPRLAGGNLRFVASTLMKNATKYSEDLIEKRGLAKRILRFMGE